MKTHSVYLCKGHHIIFSVSTGSKSRSTVRVLYNWIFHGQWIQLGWVAWEYGVGYGQWLLGKNPRAFATTSIKTGVKLALRFMNETKRYRHNRS